MMDDKNDKRDQFRLPDDVIAERRELFRSMSGKSAPVVSRAGFGPTLARAREHARKAGLLP